MQESSTRRYRVLRHQDLGRVVWSRIFRRILVEVKTGLSRQMSFVRVSILSLSRIDVQSFRVLLLRRSRRFLLLSCITCQCDPIRLNISTLRKWEQGCFVPFKMIDHVWPLSRTRTKIDVLKSIVYSRVRLSRTECDTNLITFAAASSCLETTLECDPPVQCGSISYFHFLNSVLTGLGSDGLTSSTHNEWRLISMSILSEYCCVK